MRRRSCGPIWPGRRRRRSARSPACRRGFRRTAHPSVRSARCRRCRRCPGSPRRRSTAKCPSGRCRTGSASGSSACPAPAAAARWSATAGRGVGACRSMLIMISASSLTVFSAGAQRATFRPSRMIVAAEHSARTSSSLWLMYRIEQPSDASRRSVTNSFCTSVGVSTEVGSSMISSFGFCSRQRTISMRWRSPTDRSCTTRSGSSGRPYSVEIRRMRSRSPTRSLRRAEAEGDVLGHRQRFEQREMLEHHADAQALRMARVLDRDLLAFPDDLAGIGLDHAVDDLDQRALAGAVLAQQRVDLVALDRQRNLIVGQAAGILLGHAGHRQQRAGRRGLGHGDARG